MVQLHALAGDKNMQIFKRLWVMINLDTRGDHEKVQNFMNHVEKNAVLDMEKATHWDF